MKCSVRRYVNILVRRVPVYLCTHVLSFESRDSLTPRPMIQPVPLCQPVPVAPAGLVLVTGTLALLGL